MESHGVQCCVFCWAISGDWVIVLNNFDDCSKMDTWKSFLTKKSNRAVTFNSTYLKKVMSVNITQLQLENGCCGMLTGFCCHLTNMAFLGVHMSYSYGTNSGGLRLFPYRSSRPSTIVFYVFIQQFNYCLKRVPLSAYEKRFPFKMGNNVLQHSIVRISRENCSYIRKVER